MKTLVVGPSWVGDMIMSQSLYKVIKKKHPHSHLDVLAPKWCKPLLDRMPEVDSSIEIPLGHGELNLGVRFKLANSISENNYSNAIVAPNSAKSALIPFMARIPKRTGWKGEFRYGLLNDLRPNRKVFQYMVERYVALAYKKEDMVDLVSLENCPKPSLNIDREAQTLTINKLNLKTTVPIIGICPGAEFGPAKRWPDFHYAKVTQHAINKGFQVWLFGSVRDFEVTKKIRMSLPQHLQNQCVNLAGQTSLIEAVDLLAHCHTVVSNDSGLMHVSAAVGCNIVAIYGSSSPNYTPPLTDKLQIVNTDLDCRPCFKRECPLEHLDCLNKLSPKLVITALEKFISKGTNEISLV